MMKAIVDVSTSESDGGYQQPILGGGTMLYLVKFTLLLLTWCCCCWTSSDARDVGIQTELYQPNYKVYHNLSTIYQDLRRMAQQYPGYIHLDESYKSRFGNSQPVIHVTNFSSFSTRRNNVQSSSVSKTMILLSYGEHAREFLPVESMFHLLRNLTVGISSPTDSAAYKYSKSVLSEIDLFVITMMNPDGRRHIETSQNYCWRGTSTGVDLDRNFDWNFGGRGSSAKQTDEEFRGENPFSEPECKVLLDLTSKYSFDVFVSLHSGIRQILLPFTDSHSKKYKIKPLNYENQMKMAKDLASCCKPKLSYRYGLAYELSDYTADGTIYDYLSGARNIPFSYAIELWGDGETKNSKCFDVFNPKSEDLMRKFDATGESHSNFHVSRHWRFNRKSVIQESVRLIHPMYVNLFTSIIHWKHQQVTNGIFNQTNLKPFQSTFMYFTVVVIVVVILLLLMQMKIPKMFLNRRRVVSLRSLSSTFTFSSLKNNL